MSSEVVVGAIAGIASVVGAWFLYKGATRTSDAAKTAAQDTSRVDAQADALDAWKDLLQPYRDEVAEVRRALDTERLDRRRDANRIAQEQAAQARQMAKLQSEVTRWQQVAKTIARWATQLRDEVLRLGGSVPATPEELLTLQAIDEATDQP